MILKVPNITIALALYAVGDILWRLYDGKGMLG